jgi:hypothetical protein
MAQGSSRQAEKVQAAVEVSASDAAELRRVFPGASAEDVVRELTSLAVQEWIAWITGAKRPSSLSDLELERIIGLFSRIAPGQEIEASALYNLFNLPYGRAQYLARAIAERQIRELNQRGVLELFSALEARLKEFEKLPKNEQSTFKEYRFDVSQRAGRILSGLATSMGAASRPTSYERIPNPMAGRYSFKLSPKDLRTVLEAIRAQTA